MTHYRAPSREDEIYCTVWQKPY